MKERDVFKASHDKQAEQIEQGGNPSESAQVSLRVDIDTPHPCMPLAFFPSSMSGLITRFMTACACQDMYEFT